MAWLANWDFCGYNRQSMLSVTYPTKSGTPSSLSVGMFDFYSHLIYCSKHSLHPITQTLRRVFIFATSYIFSLQCRDIVAVDVSYEMAQHLQSLERFQRSIRPSIVSARKYVLKSERVHEYMQK